MSEDIINYEITKKFYDGYIYNLENTMFQQKWIKLLDLNIKADKNRTWGKISEKDLYIKKYKSDKIGLALHIVKNGTYWPIFVYKDEGKYYVAEGIHRVESLKLLNNKNINNKEFYCINIPKSINEIIIKKIPLNSVDIEWPKSLKIPIATTLNPYYKVLYTDYSMFCNYNYNNINNSNNGDIVNLKANNIREYMSMFKFVPKVLREVFFKYEEKNQQPYPTSNKINVKVKNEK